MTAKEAFNDITHELRQRHMDMYADCDKESVSLVIDEMNKRETIVVQALTKLEELEKDVKRFMELYNPPQPDDEYDILRVKLSKVGKEK